MLLAPPIKSPKLLLHSCCAPCSSAIIECLLQNDIRPTVFYFNPNIFPIEEYITRKEEAKRYVHALGLDFVDADYDHHSWRQGIAGLEQEPERGARCEQCFFLRLSGTARYAAEHGFNLFTTTLASSRWKNLDQIFWAGEQAQKLFPSTLFWAQNWRKGGLQQRRQEIIRSFNFYNQNYCGCEFSIRLEQTADNEKVQEKEKGKA